MAMMPWKSAAVETDSERAALELTHATSDHDILTSLAEEGNPDTEKTGYSSQQLKDFLKRDLGSGQTVQDVLAIAHELRQRYLSK